MILFMQLLMSSNFNINFQIIKQLNAFAFPLLYSFRYSFFVVKFT